MSKWSLNPLSWFKRKAYGVHVEVLLDYEFGHIQPCMDPSQDPGFRPLLYIPDLDIKDAEQLEEKQFDWHAIHSHWRAGLELGDRTITKTWAEVQAYLRPRRER